MGGEGFFGLSSPPGPFVTMLSYLGVAAVFAAGLGFFLVRPNRPPRRLANRRAALAALSEQPSAVDSGISAWPACAAISVVPSLT